MATDTIPAAVPAPEDPPNPNMPSSPQPGLLASMLAPVDPARPAFDLSAPTAGTTGGDASTPSTSDASSAAYHGDSEATANDGTGARTIEKKGIWRAWLLAGAARWGKGGGAHNKRLDLAKAKAQARQVKETRQVTVNRSGGLPGKPSAANGAGGKSLGSKSAGIGPVKEPRNSNGNQQKGSSGRSGANGASGSGGGNGRGSGGGGSSSGNSNGSPRPKNPKNGGDGGSPKLSKGNDGKAGASGSSGGGSGSGKNGAAGPSGAAGKDGAGAGGKGSGSGSASDGKDGKSGNGPLAKGGTGKDSKPSDGPSGKTPGAKGGPGADGSPGKASAAGPGGTGTGPSGSSKDSKTGKPDPPGTRPPTGEHAKEHKGKPFSTRESREAGYRDGTRAARAVAHVKAYKDGVKDGWDDTSEAAERDKDRLDKAHATRKAELQGSTQGQAVQIEDDNEPMEDPFMSQATPIQAQGIDAKKITLGEGFLKPSVTRGELRRFKDYEGRLEARIDGLSRTAEATKTLAAQAREQAGDCQKLAEEAKGVKGGEKVVGQLQKLADQAKAQADEANEVHKRAAKAHDFAKAVLSNVQTRYAPLYQAVVDSDETKPAELKFYADRGVTPTSTALAA
ncbi:hypothetical protein [Streptomyces hebeiensis]